MNQFPTKTGIVANINHPPPYDGAYKYNPAALAPVMHLADMLILYDSVVLRLDHETIWGLYRTFYVDELEILLKNKRLIFMPAINVNSATGYSFYDTDGKASVEKYISELTKDTEVFFSRGYSQYDNTEKIVNQIEKYIQFPELDKGNELDPFIENMTEKFGKAYNVESSRIFWDSYTGFRQGIGRIADFLYLKTNSFNIDQEMIWFLSLIEQDIKGLPFQNEISDITKSYESIFNDSIDNIHKLNNLPSVVSLIAEGKWTQEKFIEIAMSQEAYDIRNWLKNNFSEDIDIRDVFFKSIKDLPAKKTWVSWGRFGTVTALTTGLSLALTANPGLAIILGIALGASDNQFGDKLINKISGKYNPNNWVSYINRQIK